MKLGAFSISLSVRDIQKSYEFYEKLGFQVIGGDMAQKWLILKNERSIIGLFEGMFEGNLLTFNPGWDENGMNADPFDDVRTIQKTLKGNGIQLETGTDETTEGPGYISLTDPDGNKILIDQHRH